MFRAELPRLYELKDCIDDPASHDAYFRDFDQNLAGSAHVKDIYHRYERDLQGLDDKAWEHLKEEAESATPEQSRSRREMPAMESPLSNKVSPHTTPQPRAASNAEL